LGLEKARVTAATTIMIVSAFRFKQDLNLVKSDGS